MIFTYKRLVSGGSHSDHIDQVILVVDAVRTYVTSILHCLFIFLQR